MPLLPFVLRSRRRYAATRFALSLAFVLLVLHAWTLARGQANGAIPYVVPGTLTTASTSSKDCFNQHLCGDNGPLSQASFVQPDGMAFDGSGNLYIVDASDARVRKVTKGTGPIREGIVTSFVGQAGITCASPASPCGDGNPVSDPSVLLNAPSSIAFNAAGDLFIADFGDNRVRRVDHQTFILTTYAGNGDTGFLNPSNIDGLPATQVGIQPKKLAVGPDGTLYILDGQSNGLIRAVDPLTHRIRAYAGSTSGCTGCNNVPATQADIGIPSEMAVAANGDLYFTESFGENLVRKVAKSTGLITTVAGGGGNYPYNVGQSAKDTDFLHLQGLLILPSGDLLVVDSTVNQIFRIEMSTDRLYPIAGCSSLMTCPNDTPAATKQRIYPRYVAIDTQGNIFFTDQGAEQPINEVENTPATINFAYTALNTRSSDSPQTVYLMNFGAQVLTLATGTTGAPSTFNPLLTTTTVGAENSFTLDNTVADGVTTACPSPSSAPTPDTLASGSTCGFDIAFQPTTTGVITGSLTIRYDGTNPVAPEQVIPLNSKTTIPASTASATVAARSIEYGTASVTLQASVTYTGSSAPSGAATFAVNGGAAVTATCNGSASPLTCTATYTTSTLAVGSYPITFQVAANSTYAETKANGTVTVNKASATVTLGSLSATYDGKPHAASVVTTPSGLSVSVTYNGSFNEPSAAGTYTVTATVTDPNYSGSATGTLVINGLTTPTITFSIPSHVFGDADFGIAAISNSSGALSYRVVSGPAMLSGTTIHLTGAGSVAVEVSQAATGSNAAASKTAVFVVAKATPSIQWPTPSPVAYGTAIGAAQLNARAIGIGGAALAGTFVYTPPSGSAAVHAPSETLQVVFTPADMVNYSGASAAVPLTVTQAVLDVTANDATRVYGTANPVFQGTISGQRNGDTFTESFSTTATPTSNAGTYAIVPAAVGPNLSGYTQRVHPGTLTLTQARVQVSAVSSIPSPTAGQGVVLTATVLSSTSGTPTGTVQLLENGAVLGAATLSGTHAALPVAFARGGTHVLVLAYSGDTNFLPNATTVLSLPVTPQDFTLTLLSSPSTGFHVGESETYGLRVTPPPGQTFAEDVHMSYSAEMPFYAMGKFSAVKVDAGAGSTDLTFRFVTTRAAMRETPARRGLEIAAAMLLPLFLLRRRKALRGMTLVAIAVAMLLASSALSGCGTGYAPNRIPVVITAESSGVTHTVTIEANVLQTAQ